MGAALVVVGGVEGCTARAIVGAEEGAAETGATVGAGLGPGSAIIGGAETGAVCATVGANMTAARAVGAVEG